MRHHLLSSVTERYIRSWLLKALLCVFLSTPLSLCIHYSHSLFAWTLPQRFSERTTEYPTMWNCFRPSILVNCGLPNRRKCVCTQLRSQWALPTVYCFHEAIKSHCQWPWSELQGIMKHSLQQFQGFVIKGKSGVSSQVQFLQFGRQVFW